MDTTHPFTLNCTSAYASGSFPASHVSTTPANLGTVAASTEFIHCSILGIAFNAHLNKPATLQASAYSPGSNPPATGVTKGKITDYSLNWVGSGNSCHATITGSLPVSYRNKSHELKWTRRTPQR